MRIALFAHAARTAPEAEISGFEILFASFLEESEDPSRGVARGVHAARSASVRVEARPFRAPTSSRTTHGAVPATKRYKLLQRGRRVRPARRPGRGGSSARGPRPLTL